MILKLAKTCGGGEERNNNLKQKGFTLPEILIALVVIGIIAALTISIINSNIRKTEIETKLKKAVSVFNGALNRATVDHGPAYNWPDLQKLQPEPFMNKYLVPYLMTLKPAEEVSLSDLGYTKGIKTPAGGNYANLNDITTPKKRIFLNDGTIILATTRQSVDIIYTIDINGPKGPNIIGKDIFHVGIDFRSENPIAGMALQKITSTSNGVTTTVDRTWANLKQVCGNNGLTCGAMIQRNGWKIPNDYPLKI